MFISLCCVIPIFLCVISFIVYLYSNCLVQLHYAAKSGNISLCRLLLRHGANIRLGNRAGDRPENVAVHAQHFECASYLQACEVLTNGALGLTQRTNTMPLTQQRPLQMHNARLAERRRSEQQSGGLYSPKCFYDRYAGSIFHLSVMSAVLTK